ncbi:MAG: FAD-binding oxidoreductase [Actinomycetes bacterium]
MSVVTHDAHGWWLADVWGDRAPTQRPGLVGHIDASVVIVGGGFVGMWTALGLAKELDPESIVVLDREICGTGPSGRNGGFCDTLVHATPRLVESAGPEAAERLLTASEKAVDLIGAWAEAQEADIWFCKGGQLIINSGLGQEGEWDDAVAAAGAIGRADALIPLSISEVAGRCVSPVFRDGAFAPATATVNPGRLSMALRDALLGIGVRVFEGTEASAVSSTDGGVRVTTEHGSVTAERGVLAAGAASASFPGLRREVTLTSSHIVMTEPVPDLLESVGWTGGEAITDARTLVHYFRTTPDGRILFGWGGGRIARGERAGDLESVDSDVISQVMRDLTRFFPGIDEARLDHAWGGPIDASPSHLPALRRFAPNWIAAFGFTGNGVGPSRLLGDAIVDEISGRFNRSHPVRPLLVDKPTLVPPEPWRQLGGKAIRASLDRVERAGEFGRPPPRVSKLVAGLPSILGYRIGR